MSITKYRVRYQTIEVGPFDLNFKSLRDNLQFSDDEAIAEHLGITSALWPLFGQSWPSGEVLAHYMADFQVQGKRVLEVGCGLGLASLILNLRHADITASDYHPEVEPFLRANALLNGDTLIPFYLSNWRDLEDKMGRFDLIIGSDLLYERGHARELSQFINLCAKTSCEVVLVDPGRHHQNQFTREMASFAFTHHSHAFDNRFNASTPFSGLIHHYCR